MVWPAVIAAGATLASSVLGANAQPSSRQSRSFALHQGTINWDRQRQLIDEAVVRDRRSIQDRAADARAAGLHPLFAMGVSGAGISPTTVQSSDPYPGQSSSGSHLGRGIEKAGQQIAAGMTRAGNARMRAAQLRNLEARSTLTEAQAMQIASDTKRIEQSAWTQNTGVVGDFPLEEAKTFPVGTKRGLELYKRPLTQSSRSSIPEKIEVMGKDGFRYRIVNPALGDEVSQFDYAYEKGKRVLKKIFRNPRRGKWRPRPKPQYQRYRRKW